MYLRCCTIGQHHANTASMLLSMYFSSHMHEISHAMSPDGKDVAPPLPSAMPPANCWLSVYTNSSQLCHASGCDASCLPSAESSTRIYGRLEHCRHSSHNGRVMTTILGALTCSCLKHPHLANQLLCVWPGGGGRALLWQSGPPGDCCRAAHAVATPHASCSRAMHGSYRHVQQNKVHLAVRSADHCLHGVLQTHCSMILRWGGLVCAGSMQA